MTVERSRRSQLDVKIVRGQGQFERISCDKALDILASELKRIKGTYGPRAIWCHTYSGQPGIFHSGAHLRQLLRDFGGYTSSWGGASAEGSVFASRATYGTLVTGHTRDDLVNSRLILLWGVNPAASIFGTNTSFYLAQAKEASARIIVIDPRYSDTAAAFADQWVPIRPGTDAAMMAAMAHVMISESLHNERFLHKYTVGFGEFREYVTGAEDGIAKTPDWAEAKTGVPADTIVSLAGQYSTMKPAALIPGYAPGRTAFGEQFHRAASTLAAMTGNIGIHGGGAAGFERGPVGPHAPPAFFRVKDGATYNEQVRALDVARRLRTQPHFCNTWDFILKGTAGGYSHDIKMAYIAGANPLNQLPNINKGVEALKKLEFIVVHELFMTATAKFADILLPVTTHWERNDFARPWLSGPYFLYLNKVIEPVFDVRNDRDICRDLAVRLGIMQPGFNLPEEESIRQWMEFMGDMMEVTADFEGFKESGVHKMKLGAPRYASRSKSRIPKSTPSQPHRGRLRSTASESQILVTVISRLFPNTLIHGKDREIHWSENIPYSLSLSTIRQGPILASRTIPGSGSLSPRHCGSAPGMPNPAASTMETWF